MRIKMDIINAVIQACAKRRKPIEVLQRFLMLRHKIIISKTAVEHRIDALKWS